LSWVLVKVCWKHEVLVDVLKLNYIVCKRSLSCYQYTSIRTITNSKYIRHNLLVSATCFPLTVHYVCRYVSMASGIQTPAILSMKPGQTGPTPDRRVWRWATIWRPSPLLTSTWLRNTLQTFKLVSERIASKQII